MSKKTPNFVALNEDFDEKDIYHLIKYYAVCTLCLCPDGRDYT